MTDVQIAPADVGSVEVPVDIPSHSEPLSSQVHAPEQVSTPEPKADVKPPSAREAIENAHKALEAKEKAAPEVKAEAKARAEDGKFAAKQQDPKVAEASAKAADAPVQTADKSQSEGRVSRYEAPARFDEQGKSEWANAPESVQKEVHRAIKNLEDGYTKYKESAERYETVREYDELARKNGREGVHESLKQVVEIEKAFARDPIEGMKKITDHFGLNLQAVAAHIMGQQPNLQVQEAHNRIRELEAKIQHMELEKTVPKMIEEFAAKHDRFEELADDIAFFLKSGITPDLETAYEMSARFRPANANASSAKAEPSLQASSAVETASSAPVPPNPAGQKSVTGSPASGTTQAAVKKGPPPSIADAIRQASSRLTG